LHPQALRATLASLAHFLLPPRAAPQPSPYTTFPLIPARPAISPPRRPPENSIPLRRAPIHVSPTELSHRRATRKLLIRCYTRFNSLIRRKIRLIRRVTNLRSKPLK